LERHEQQYIATAASSIDVKLTSSNDHFARQKQLAHQLAWVKSGSDLESKIPRGGVSQPSQKQSPVYITMLTCVEPPVKHVTQWFHAKHIHCW